MKKALIFCTSLLVIFLMMSERVYADDLDGTNWMSKLPDDRYLYEINIPGSHDAATATAWHEPVRYAGYDVEPYLRPFAIAQDRTIDELLDSGVRALDLRLTNWVDDTGLNDGDLILAHGDEDDAWCFRCRYAGSPTGFLTLTDVLDQVTDFLGDHPTETVILTVKPEYDDGKHKNVWASLKDTISSYDQTRLYIEGEWPTLGDVRGKAVICSTDKASLGLDVIQISADNDQTTTNCSKTDTIDPVHLFYENHWSVSADDKASYVNRFLDNIHETLGRRGEGHFDTAGLLYSSSNLITTDVETILEDIIIFIFSGQFPDDWQTPRQISGCVNPLLKSRVGSMADLTYFGIVLADFSEQVSEAIWKSNYPDDDWDYYEKHLLRYYDKSFSLVHLDLVTDGSSTTIYDDGQVHQWMCLDDTGRRFTPGDPYTPRTDLRLGVADNAKFINFENTETGQVTDWPKEIIYYPDISSSVVLPDNIPKLSGRVFIEWKDPSDPTRVYSPGASISTAALPDNYTLQAEWMKAEELWYIAYNANGGTSAPTPTMGIQDMDIEVSRELPVWDGKKFTGWTTSPCPSSGDYRYKPGETIHAEYMEHNVLVLYAQWEPDPEAPVVITFDSNGVEGVHLPESISCASGSRVKLKGAVAPLGGQHVFQGWSRDSAATIPEYRAGDMCSFTESTTLYAIWREVGRMTLMFLDPFPDESSGLPDPITISTTEPQSVRIPEEIPTKSGRVFTGWNTSVSGAGTQYAPGDSISLTKSNTVLWAQWRMPGDDWYVIYLPNGGTVVPKHQVIKRGQDATISDEIPKNEGLDFLGWATDKKSLNPVYQPGDKLPYDSGKNYVVLYAVWSDSHGSGSDEDDNDDGISEKPVKATVVNPDAIIAYFLVNGIKLDAARFAKQIQGPLGRAALNIGRPAGWQQAFTFNMTVNDKADHSMKNGYLVLVIPPEYRKEGRTFAIMGLDVNGKPRIFNDTDTIPSTVTAKIDLAGYAFALIYNH